MEKEYYFNAEISSQFNFQPFGNAFQTNPNFEDPMEQCSQYETALSSMVSSPSASNSVTDHFAVRELFGKLGNVNNGGDISPEFMQRSSYMNSPNTSCYNTPIDSPPELQVPIMNTFVKENMPILGSPMHMSSALPALPTDPGFAERAAKFSCFGSRSLNGRTTPVGINNAEFHYRNSRQLMGIASLPRVSSSPSLNADGSPMVNRNYVQNQMNMRSDNGSNEESSVSEQIPNHDIVLPTQVELGSRKRKGFPRGKAKEAAALIQSTKVAEGEENLNIKKRSKMTSENENGGVKKEEETNIDAEEDKKQDNNSQKPPEPPKDYIHVRARRGQATDSHSLAERVRREKISERMKLLQDLVPGCNKVTGKAVMLDEIINYVQSLQRQVEFLSMKLSTVNSSQNVNIVNLLPKDMFQPNGSFSNQMYPVESSASAYHGQQTPQLHDKSVQPLDATLCRNLGIQLEGYGEGLPQFPAFSEDDLQSIVQTGFAPNQTSHMNIEL